MSNFIFLLPQKSDAHTSKGWTLASGALNYQATHHLVPYIHQYYYPEVAPIIRKVAEKYGVKYLRLESFSDALSSHLGYLNIMGQKPKAKAN